MTTEELKQRYKEIVFYGSGKALSTSESLNLLSQLIISRDTLEKLAKLGNEPYQGNSDGNVIAQRAIVEMEELK